VKDDDHPYLAYSPEITIRDSSEPFRAFLGAILSVVKDVPVERSAYKSDMKLDIITEEEDDSPLPEDDIDGGLGAYQDSSGGMATTSRPATRSRAHDEHENTESELMFLCSLADICRLACSFTLRLLHPPRILPNISKYGCISIACGTTRSLSLSALRAANSAYGLPAL
jgi:hypothetical protein